MGFTASENPLLNTNHGFHRRERKERREYQMGKKLNQISEAIIGAAISVHRELGPGLLESAYEACLEYELLDLGFDVKRQQAVPVIYRGFHVDCGFRVDLLVNGLVIVELKSVETLNRIHDAQLLTYLKLTKLHLGLLMNFNVTRLIDGIRRLVRDFPT
jgi:GxxExxY protein